MKLQERYVEIEELTKSHKENLINDFHVFSDGWKSTCNDSPMDGSIFMDIEEECVVTFKDKYRQSHTGILTSFYYDKYYNTIYVTVRSTMVNPYYNGSNLVDGAMSYLILLKTCNLVTGEMPKIPNKPTFK